MVKKMDIYIIGGFLGSGKTTLLVNLLKTFENQKTAVLMNELGGFNVDSKIIGEDTPYNEMLNGCICCDLKADVEVQINDLYHRHHPEVIIIEATGAAHPVEIYDACTSPGVTSIARVKNMTVLIDSKRFLDRSKYTMMTAKLMEDQIKYAHTIIVNKMDLIDEEQQHELDHSIAQINPDAKVVHTSYAVVPDNLWNETGSAIQGSAPVRHGLMSFVYEFTGPVDARMFVAWLRELPDSVLRVKGFLKFREQPDQVVLFQYAYGIPQYEEEMMNMPLKLVIIGEQMDKNKILSELDKLQFS